ncbi:MAG: hypothetical protein WDZ83_04865 [Rhizobiaceae bacterium]
MLEMIVAAANHEPGLVPDDLGTDGKAGGFEAYHPSGFNIDYGIRDILYQHRNAFTDWRYLHEPKKSMMFDQSAFEATLELVLREFDKRYRIEPVGPPWSS